MRRMPHGYAAAMVPCVCKNKSAQQCVAIFVPSEYRRVPRAQGFARTALLERSSNSPVSAMAKDKLSARRGPPLVPASMRGTWLGGFIVHCCFIPLWVGCIAPSVLGVYLLLCGGWRTIAGLAIFSFISFLNFAVHPHWRPWFLRIIYELDMAAYYKKCELRGELPPEWKPWPRARPRSQGGACTIECRLLPTQMALPGWWASCAFGCTTLRVLAGTALSRAVRVFIRHAGALESIKPEKTLFMFHPHGILSVGFVCNGVWSRQFNDYASKPAAQVRALQRSVFKHSLYVCIYIYTYLMVSVSRSDHAGATTALRDS